MHYIYIRKAYKSKKNISNGKNIRELRQKRIDNTLLMRITCIPEPNPHTTRRNLIGIFKTFKSAYTLDIDNRVGILKKEKATKHTKR